MTNLPNLAELLQQVAEGRISVAAALDQLPAASHQMAPIDGATVDLGRQNRCAFSEVIYGAGKSAELICRIVKTQLDAGQTALATRVEPGVALAVTNQIQFAHHNPLARTLTIYSQDTDHILTELDSPFDGFHAAVVTAGSTDKPVAEEAKETLSWMGIPFTNFEDIGVAGPQRLLAAVPLLRKASVVIVIAGMEGALPAAAAGHLSVPIIAVPTSVGYGASLNGLTPLLGMLSSCAANVSVVNIDAGFKAGYLAGLIVDQLRSASGEKS